MKRRTPNRLMYDRNRSSNVGKRGDRRSEVPARQNSCTHFSLNLSPQLRGTASKNRGQVPRNELSDQSGSRTSNVREADYRGVTNDRFQAGGLSLTLA
jgi:hypothetical protein